MLGISFFLLAVLNIDSLLQENPQRKERNVRPSPSTPTKSHTFEEDKMKTSPYLYPEKTLIQKDVCTPSFIAARLQ